MILQVNHDTVSFMNDHDTRLLNLPAIEATSLIAAGKISPVEFLEACIQQIQRINPAVNALVTLAFDRARSQARVAEAAVQKGEVLGQIHGLPVAIKDIQNTEGIVTTFGSEKLANNVPDKDAGIVARIRNAGGIIIGKTNVPEMSIGANTVNPLFGATGNPFDPTLTCGGSSGGSGVAVATQMAPLATGSDHGGSLRIPACYSGVVGVRATPGVVPNEQRRSPLTNYSVQGPMARTVADSALLLSVIAARDKSAQMDPMVFPLDTRQFSHLEEIDVKALRVAVSTDLGGVLVSDSIRKTFQQKITKISRLVKTCDSVNIDLTEAPDIDWHLRQDLFVSQYHCEAAGWSEDFNPNVRATYESALRTPMAEIAQARRRQVELFREFARLFDDYDLVICPGVSVSPFSWQTMNPEFIDGKPVTNYMAWLALTSSITVVGHPVVALPCGTDSHGMPFGVQVIGKMFNDHKLLSMTQSLEGAFAGVVDLQRPIPDYEFLSQAEAIRHDP